ncbi:MAG TPA: biopolymer transporter ExbB, partial [Algoriphagus sp.]|nr:biopolymer transporter ExbB [Algoriphagus sp.]
MILLQTLSTDSFSAADSLGMDAAGQNIGLLDLLIKGGYMMIPLYLLFILAIFIFIERLMTLKKATATSSHL